MIQPYTWRSIITVIRFIIVYPEKEPQMIPPFLGELLSSHLAELESKGMEADWLTGCAFVTPACGVGSQSNAVAEDAGRKTSAVALAIRS